MFYWKGITSTTKKLVVSSTPMISKPERRMEKITVPGRSGFITIDEGVYESFVISIECHFGANANQDDILAWLDGAGKLSLDGVRQYDAIIRNTIQLKKITNIYKEFVVQFECQPIATDIAETTFEVETNPDTLAIAGATATMYPTIEITGTDDITVTINNKTFNLYDMAGKYILDSTLKVITNSLGNNVSDKMLYDFPTLQPGNNVISTTGTISEFIIKYNKSYL